MNTNKLIRNYEGATGLKTGSTSLALFNLSASATRDNLSLIAVIMQGETSAIRFEEAKRLLDYGFSNYTYATCGNKYDLINTVQINKGIFPNVNAILETNVGVLASKSKAKNITSIIDLPETIDAPIYKGQKIGEISFFINDELVQTANIVAEEDIPKITFSNIVSNVFQRWINLLR